jgi:V/A-type H+-transporting ATPase subunit E
MPLQELLDALEEEGTAAHEKAQQDRRRQAAQIMAEAQDRADTARDEILTAAETAALQEADTILAAARVGARRASRTARDDALEQVRARAAERLLGLPGSPEGAVAARACVHEALVALPHATTVHVHPADVDAVRSDTIEVIADLATGGATAEDDTGRYIDNTYLTRLANVWPDTRVRLSRAWDRP